MRQDKMSDKIMEERIEELKKRFDHSQQIMEIVEEDEELLKKLE